MIFPEPLMDDALFQSFAEKNEAIVKTYEVTTWNPATCMDLLQNAADEFIANAPGRNWTAGV